LGRYSLLGLSHNTESEDEVLQVLDKAFGVRPTIYWSEIKDIMENARNQSNPSMGALLKCNFHFFYDAKEIYKAAEDNQAFTLHRNEPLRLISWSFGERFPRATDKILSPVPIGTTNSKVLEVANGEEWKKFRVIGWDRYDYKPFTVINFSRAEHVGLFDKFLWENLDNPVKPKTKDPETGVETNAQAFRKLLEMDHRKNICGDCGMPYYTKYHPEKTCVTKTGKKLESVTAQLGVSMAKAKSFGAGTTSKPNTSAFNALFN